MLVACASSNIPLSVVGECSAFHDPGFAVKGKTRKDSQWISGTQETGIRVCHWNRPQPHKAAMLHRKKPAAAKKPPVAAPQAAPAEATAPAPTATENKRLRDRVRKLNNEIRQLRGAEPK